MDQNNLQIDKEDQNQIDNNMPIEKENINQQLEQKMINHKKYQKLTEQQKNELKERSKRISLQILEYQREKKEKENLKRDLTDKERLWSLLCGGFIIVPVISLFLLRKIAKSMVSDGTYKKAHQYSQEAIQGLLGKKPAANEIKQQNNVNQNCNNEKQSIQKQN